MEFRNAWWVYLLVGIVFAYVLIQSTYFLLKARKRALALGFTKEQINKTITSSMVFSLAPSIAIVLGLIALTNFFGSFIAGMRLGTLGAVTYEVPAALNVINGAFGLPDNVASISPEIAITALWVMTLGCLPPLLIIPLFFKKISGRLDMIKDKDNTWKNILMDALFIGLISAFVGFVLAPKERIDGTTGISLLSILVLVTSAAIIIILGLLMKKFKWEWLKNYAIPLAMIGAMGMALLYALLGVV
ncbi:MAG: DUF5058 family protein [Acholeplasma sp.]|jgi:hypothetical protein